MIKEKSLKFQEAISGFIRIATQDIDKKQSHQNSKFTSLHLEISKHNKLNYDRKIIPITKGSSQRSLSYRR